MDSGERSRGWLAVGFAAGDGSDESGSESGTVVSEEKGAGTVTVIDTVMIVVSTGSAVRVVSGNASELRAGITKGALVVDEASAGTAGKGVGGVVSSPTAGAMLDGCSNEGEDAKVMGTMGDANASGLLAEAGTPGSDDGSGLVIEVSSAGGSESTIEVGSAGVAGAIEDGTTSMAEVGSGTSDAASVGAGVLSCASSPDDGP